ncbi:unnamed protein product [Clonostachys byssicola]|uniref:Uncharacterized protein n=1 Tax=Clonostachys byssicola TaxID=160290 RepID=A0A9N9UBR2_9HYPO|nr:unnamed protein product [Clonostachys byssicola]
MDSTEGKSDSALQPLPAYFRENVYEYAGVPTQMIIELNRWTRDDHLSELMDESDTELLEFDPLDYSQLTVPYGLLATSRIVREEVEEKIYSSNIIAASLWLPRGLHPLERLSDTSLRALRSLVVFLCPCHCLEPFCRKNSRQTDAERDYFQTHEYRPSEGHSRQLDCISRRDKGTIAQWKRICARLASNVPPGQLELHLIADVANIQTAQIVLEPLLDLPVLKEAAISLRDEPNKSLQALAHRTSLRLVGTGEEPFQPFRFLDLPLDLQLEILKFTPLNVSDDVCWGPSERFYSRDWGTCIGQEPHHMIQPEVFCRILAAAYSAHCQCTGSPAPGYFLVSKAFGAVARAVFYSQNKFEVVPSDSYPLSGPESNADAQGRCKFVVSSFFGRMPPSAITNLSHVSLVFPPMTPAYLLPEQKAWGAWLDAVDLLERHANLPGLKLEIHFADLDVMPVEDLLARRIRSKPEDEKEMFDAYVRILGPLRKLAGLRAFFVYAAWPTHDEAEPERKADETRLEQMVMGDGYDSTRWGKCEGSHWSQPDRFWWTQYH